MQLYSERGYEQTTVAEIAKRAGVTERTFFRYFADKREVLFAGSEVLRDDMLAAFDATPASVSAIDAVRAAIEGFSVHFTQRDFSRQRQAVINANPELRERELIKLSSYACALDDALQRRGVNAATARLAAEMGLAAFRIAWERWIDEPQERPFGEILRESFDELKSVAAGTP